MRFGVRGADGGIPPWGHLRSNRDESPGPCQAGSLTGAVASQSVTEAPKGSLSTVGHRARRAKA